MLRRIDKARNEDALRRSLSREERQAAHRTKTNSVEKESTIYYGEGAEF